MIPIDPIQAQLRASAKTQFDAITIPGFTCFINPDDDSPWSNYAIPTVSDAGQEEGTLDELMRVFTARSRAPRLEYLAAFAPSLAATLEAHGFTAEDPALLMVCTHDTLRPVSPTPGLLIEALTDDHPIREMQALMTVQRRAFGDANAPAPDEEEARQFRQRFGANTFFLGKLHGRAATAGSFQLPYQGIAELAGIATLPEFRRQGLASAITSHMTEHGFSTGLDALFLTAGDEKAGRVYGRVGFQANGSALAYIKS